MKLYYRVTYLTINMDEITFETDSMKRAKDFLETIRELYEPRNSRGTIEEYWEVEQ